MSPYGLLYGEVTASCLVRVGMDGAVLDGGSTRLGVNHAGVGLHSAVYGARRDAHCVMHLHTVAGAAVGDYASHSYRMNFPFCVCLCTPGVSDEVWTFTNIRGSSECMSQLDSHAF